MKPCTIALIALTLTLAACASPPGGAEHSLGRTTAAPPKQVPLPPLDTYLYIHATTQGGPSEPSLAMDLEASQSAMPGVPTLGRFFFSHADPQSPTVNNVSFFGEVRAGTITHASGGGGSASLSGVLTDGRTFTFTAVDRNDPARQDTVTFQVIGAPTFTCSGSVTEGDALVFRAAPVGSDLIGAAGVTFDPAIGLFLDSADFAGRRPGPRTGTPDGETQLFPIDPVQVPAGETAGTVNNLGPAYENVLPPGFLNNLDAAGLGLQPQPLFPGR